MEQCFRITLLMFLLIGYLQAHPVLNTLKFNMSDIGFEDLKTVNCGSDMTFTCRPNLEESCFNTTCGCLISVLEQAKNCHVRVRMALGAIKRSCSKEKTCTHHCSWDNESKPFPDFARDMETCAESINAQSGR